VHILIGNKPKLLFKTGDLAFQDIDGNITFVGRTVGRTK
jgi:acyl-coenzyme A synthetase/AMP-(fatty) acid ligase